MAEWTPQPWIQDLLQTVEHGTRSLGEQFKVIDTTARNCIMQLRSAVGEDKRRMTGRRVKAQTVCFAKISNPFKEEQPQSKLEDVKESAQRVGEDLRVPVPEVTVVGIGKVKSLVLKQILCGVLAGAVSSFAATPFLVLRTRVAAGQGGNSTAEVLRNVADREGLQSLMEGNLIVAMIATSLQKGVQFATFEAVKRIEQKRVGQNRKLIPALPRKVQISTVAGAAAGLTSTLVVYPLQIVLDRLFLQPSTYPSIWEGAVKVVGEGGIRELYRGIIPALMRMVPQTAVGFYSYETLQEKLKEMGWQAEVSSLTAGAAAGLVSAGLTYPLEAARKLISVSAVPAAQISTTYTNVGQALACIVKQEGFGGLYRGFGAEALEIVPVTAISFLVYELAKRAFVAQHEERRDEVKE